MKVIDFPLRHFDRRPPGVAVDTVVIHSIFAPEWAQCFDPVECVRLLDRRGVASHYLIGQDGSVYRLVGELHRAWHAGESRMPESDGRENVNHFSIGIELVGDRARGFPDTQYSTLAALTADLLKRHPIRAIVGHDQIAPGRKDDPGPLFDWKLYQQRISALSKTATLVFPSISAA